MLSSKAQTPNPKHYSLRLQRGSSRVSRSYTTTESLPWCNLKRQNTQQTHAHVSQAVPSGVNSSSSHLGEFRIRNPIPKVYTLSVINHAHVCTGHGDPKLCPLPSANLQPQPEW